jgi:hypothetical protein
MRESAIGPMGLFVRTIGPARAKVKSGLAHLAANTRRMVWLSKMPPSYKNRTRREVGARPLPPKSNLQLLPLRAVRKT